MSGVAVAAAPRYALCIEETLGHRAHGQNIRRALYSRRVSADVLSIEPPPRPRMSMPWALRGSLAAYRQLHRSQRYASVFFHTQTISLLAPLAAGPRPYVVSLDATPVQVDAMGRWYEHAQGSAVAERIKRRWYREVLNRAAAVVTWSSWARDSLLADYDVQPRQTLIAHPGAGQSFFDIERTEPKTGLPTILFVGGQFERKGGDHLLEAFDAVRDRARLLLVTEADVRPRDGIEVRTGIRPNTPELLAAFAEADIFCLPTLGDCTPVAIGEAMAAGLPVVTTNVGSNSEWVTPEVGRLVEAGSTAQLAAALMELVDNPTLRRQVGADARRRALTHMHADRNAARILDLLEDVAR